MSEEAHTICDTCSLPILDSETEHRCPGKDHNVTISFDNLIEKI